MGSPPSMHLEAPAHSPKPIAPTLSNGRKLLPLPSPLHSPPGRHLSSCSCLTQLLLLFTQRCLSARTRRMLWIITHTWACLDAHTHVYTCTYTSWIFFQDIFYEGVGIGLLIFDVSCVCCAEINLVKGSFFACDGSHVVQLPAWPPRSSSGPAPSLRPAQPLWAPFSLPWPLVLLFVILSLLRGQLLPRWGRALWRAWAPAWTPNYPATSPCNTPTTARQLAHTPNVQCVK